MHRQKGFHHGDGDFVGLERNHGAVAANDLVVGQQMAGRIALRRIGVGREWSSSGSVCMCAEMQLTKSDRIVGIGDDE